MILVRCMLKNGWIGIHGSMRQTICLAVPGFFSLFCLRLLVPSLSNRRLLTSSPTEALALSLGPLCHSSPQRDSAQLTLSFTLKRAQRTDARGFHMEGGQSLSPSNIYLRKVHGPLGSILNFIEPLIIKAS